MILMLSRMKPWSIADTRRLVEARFGRAHLDRAAPSLNSLPERLHYARYHYQEIQRLLGSFTELHLATKPLLFVIHGGDEASREEFEVLMIEVGSHSTACVQSIHAISDIMAHAVYHGLGHSLDVSPLPDRDISAASVLNRLRHVPAHAAIAEMGGCGGIWFKNDAEYIRTLTVQRRAQLEGRIEEWIPKLRRDAQILCSNTKCTANAS